MSSISICIPVFNCDVKELISNLIQCSELFYVDYEIVIIDDASLERYKLLNREVQDFNNVTYIELDENIGRSAIRNLFLKHTKLDNLLFLDCDSKLLHKRFISNYLIFKSEIICGGREYQGKPKKSKHLLRWKYGIHRECKKAKNREKNPYHSFMTNNFMIKRPILGAIKFDERLTGYGHEDSLFGYQLMKNNIQIAHIDNPTIHDFNETSDEFLEKTRQGIENLVFIHTKLLPDGEFRQVNKLLAAYEKVKEKKIANLFNLLSYPVLPLITVLFRIGIVHLWCFDIYKLLYLCRVAKKN